MLLCVSVLFRSNLYDAFNARMINWPCCLNGNAVYWEIGSLKLNTFPNTSTQRDTKALEFVSGDACSRLRNGLKKALETHSFSYNTPSRLYWEKNFTSHISGRGNGIGPVGLCVGLQEPHNAPLHRGALPPRNAIQIVVPLKTIATFRQKECARGASTLGHFRWISNCQLFTQLFLKIEHFPSLTETCDIFSIKAKQLNPQITRFFDTKAPKRPQMATVLYSVTF